ncbi:uncharacterized protein BJ171DRAFT_516964 [Polychytrium aggregatum]|uniref:uncharacterized protein n=1 Tax=Polychytrium aggregatum TaxID=110093 RepID=UPI0022FF0AA8|nr:uncharacterized protein BJ171DRAFT_516964 [Polychytrium aggregatum]KAI9199774.1 hypothetical protein BJ171DRAFT_516964 [Polychytrium aggregatum]
MHRAFVLVTGATRGFGREIARGLVHATQSPLQSLKQQYPNITFDLLLTGRNLQGLSAIRDELSDRAGFNVDTLVADFADPQADRVTESIVHNIPAAPTDYSHFFLFNNAGSLGKLARTRNLQWTDIQSAIHVNVAAPLALTAKLLKVFKDCPSVDIVNVSSLAAIQEFDCWGLYAAGKAARDMIHKTIALEEGLIESAQRPNATEALPRPRVRVLNYAPGPLDTDMQAEIRKDMPAVELRDLFVDMKTKGTLVDPTESALTLLHLLSKPDGFVSGSHVDYFDVGSSDGSA